MMMPVNIRMIKSGTNGCGREDIAAALTLAADAMLARSAPSNKAVVLRLLGEPGTSGTVDLDKLFELREDTFQLVQLEQVTAGVDVQGDRLVYRRARLRSRETSDCWVLGYGIEHRRPNVEDEYGPASRRSWLRPFGGLPTVRCLGRCWLPHVGRAVSLVPSVEVVDP